MGALEKTWIYDRIWRVNEEMISKVGHSVIDTSMRMRHGYCEHRRKELAFPKSTYPPGFRCIKSTIEERLIASALANAS